MTIKDLLATVYQNPDSIEFDQVLATIDSEFDHKPTAFIVGTQQNSASQNQGSCKVLYFAHQTRLSQNHALALFGEHYRDVLNNPEGTDHQNIRQFIQSGWAKVSFDGKPLIKK